MIQFKENAWTDGRKDGQTLFYRALPATTGSPIKELLIIILHKYTKNHDNMLYCSGSMVHDRCN